MRNAWVVLAAIFLALILAITLSFLAMQPGSFGRRKPFIWDGVDVRAVENR